MGFRSLTCIKMRRGRKKRGNMYTLVPKEEESTPIDETDVTPSRLVTDENIELNPNMAFEEQVQRLPFIKKWEVQKEDLIMGKVVGSGFFGEVRKAELMNSNNNGTPRVVAVKTSKVGFDFNLEALLTEIKVMSYIGYHINIVNFVGACTDVGNDIYLITEFCKHGNLQSYLKRYREFFESQLQSEGNNIDPRKCSTTSVSFSLLQKLVSQDLMKYEKDYHKLAAATAGIENRFVTLFTLDLVSWVFQICSGMVFLSSRKVIHRDLACRNILLAEGKVVKICDFGLAKNIYGSRKEYYRRQHDIPLPKKWMAVESLEDGVFTSKSDIWSFGVVLWELFSLGETPYNGDSVDDFFVHRLKQGYRLKKPKEQPEFVLEPNQRPNFRELEQYFKLEIQNVMQNIVLDESKRMYQPPPDILNTGKPDIEDKFGYVRMQSTCSDNSQRTYANSVPSIGGSFLTISNSDN